MTFRIIVPAESTGVTTLKTLKDELSITGTAQDKKLQRMINRISSEFCAYMNVPTADDGTRTIGLETIEESLISSPWLRSGRSAEITLRRKPVNEIVSVIVGGVTVDTGDYELEGATGILKRVWITTSGFFTDQTSRTVIRYQAGWTLPGDDSEFTMPPDIEGAAIDMIRAARMAMTRDPAVKAQWVTDIERLEFWVGQIGENGSLPPSITAKLDPYCYEPSVG